jgi:predicted lactoylglutathione lyase
MIFPNLAVKDLGRAVAFFSELGFGFDERFTDDTATAMIVNEQATVMLLTEGKFAEFATRPLADATRQTETIIALSGDSREDVDALADKALAVGATAAKEPMDLGFMYARSFHDPDGHHWEIVWMDPTALERGPVEAGAAA